MTDRPDVGLALTLAALLVLSTAAPAVAAPDASYDDKLSITAENTLDLWPSAPANLERASVGGAENVPMWLVRYDSGRLSTLESWANTSDSRRVVEHNNDSRWAVVVAPSSAVDGGLLEAGLVGKSYVERIDANQRLEYAAPLESLDYQNTTNPPTDSAMLYAESYDAAGVAYNEDAERTGLADARSALGVDTVSETGSGQTIAVLDTGFNYAQGRVSGNGTRGSTDRIVGARNFVTDEDAVSSNDYANVSDGNGHGSWVTTAAAGNLSGTADDGVAPDADILVGKTLADDGSGSTGDIVDGIYWAERNNATIISLSLGSPTYSPAIATAIEDALAGNVTGVFVAAGNSRMSPIHAQRYISSPADVDGVVSVAATTSEDPTDAEVAYFSEVGPDSGTRDLSRGVTNGEGPDLAAPGMEIEARVPLEDGTLANRTLSGTSMATPLAAGVGALAVENDTGTLYNETGAFRARLLESARPIPQAGVTEVGHGMAAAGYAINDSDPPTQQIDERTDAAIARDGSNEAYSQSRLVRIAIGGTTGIQSALSG